jgi:hypothetical protein
MPGAAFNLASFSQVAYTQLGEGPGPGEEGNWIAWALVQESGRRGDFLAGVSLTAIHQNYALLLGGIRTQRLKIVLWWRLVDAQQSLGR